MIKLGDRVRDQISGFTGIAASRTEYLNGCVRITIEPETLHEGKTTDSLYIDEQQIEVVEEAAYMTLRIALNREETGGPDDRKPPTAWKKPPR